jgi:hypothetical protein
MSDVSTQIVKVILTTADRTNQNDDTSDCRFMIEPIQNVQSFCIRRALLPLSSYSFTTEDSDRQLVITNTGEYPNGVYDTGGIAGARYVSIFAKPTGVIFDQAKTFNQQTKDVSTKIAWCFLDAGDVLSVGFFRNGTYVKYVARTNTTGDTAYYSYATFTQYINTALQSSGQGGWGSFVTIKCSAFGDAPQPGDARQLVNFEAQAVPGRIYWYADWTRTPDDPAWGGTTQIDIWLTRPVANYDSIIAQFTNNSTTSANFVTPQTMIVNLSNPTLFGIQNWNIVTVTFDVNQQYTIAQIISTWNADPQNTGILGIQRTQDALDPTGLPLNRIYLYNNIGVNVPDFYLVAMKWLVPNVVVGWTGYEGYKQFFNVLGSFNKDHLLIGGEQYNLTPDIIVKTFAIPNLGASVTPQADFAQEVNTLISPYGIQFYNSVDYLNINHLSENGWTGTDLANLNVDEKFCYGFRFDPSQTTYDLGGLLLSPNPLPDAQYVPQYWLDRHAAFESTTDTNSYAVNNVYYLHSRPSTQYINFPTNTVVTTSILQTSLNTILAPLTATIQASSNTILFVNGGASTYQIRANKRLGIYDDSQPDSVFIITPSETRNTAHPIDLSCDNSVLFVGLNLYHDGRSSIGIGDPKAGKTRPSRKNIVASVHNTSNVVYGGHISYTNDADHWLPSYVRDLTEMHLSVYNSSLEQADLNKQDVFLEIDLKCNTYGINR